MFFKYLIIGSSAAGLSAARTIRQLDPNASVGIITKSGSEQYHTCWLTKYIVGSLTAEQLVIYNEFEACKNSIFLKPRTQVVKLDPEKKCVEDSSGTTFFYEKCLLAVGTIPQVPSWLSIDHEKGIFTYHTAEDVFAIESYIQKRSAKSILIVGGGVNGLECAAAWHTRGYKVTLLEKNRILGQLPENASAWIKNLFLDRNISIIEHAQVNACEVLEHTKKISLADGSSIYADIIICAAGVKSALEKIEIPAIQLHNSRAVVDSLFQTSVPDLFTAGDCATRKHGVHYFSSSKWSDAVRQGMSAAHAVVLAEEKYTLQPSVLRTKFFGIECVWYGVCGNESSSTFEKRDKASYLYYETAVNQSVTSFVSCGDPQQALALQKQIRIEL